MGILSSLFGGKARPAIQYVIDFEPPHTLWLNIFRKVKNKSGATAAVEKLGDLTADDDSPFRSDETILALLELKLPREGTGFPLDLRVHAQWVERFRKLAEAPPEHVEVRFAEPAAALKLRLTEHVKRRVVIISKGAGKVGIRILDIFPDGSWAPTEKGALAQLYAVKDGSIFRNPVLHPRASKGLAPLMGGTETFEGPMAKKVFDVTIPTLRKYEHVSPDLSVSIDKTFAEAPPVIGEPSISVSLTPSDQGVQGDVRIDLGGHILAFDEYKSGKLKTATHEVAFQPKPEAIEAVTDLLNLIGQDDCGGVFQLYDEQIARFLHQVRPWIDKQITLDVDPAVEEMISPEPVTFALEYSEDGPVTISPKYRQGKREIDPSKYEQAVLTNREFPKIDNRWVPADSALVDKVVEFRMKAQLGVGQPIAPVYFVQKSDLPRILDAAVGLVEVVREHDLPAASQATVTVDESGDRVAIRTGGAPAPRPSDAARRMPPAASEPEPAPRAASPEASSAVRRADRQAAPPKAEPGAGARRAGKGEPASADNSSGSGKLPVTPIVFDDEDLKPPAASP